ncbi:molybdate ABC transporter, inner membrane subunit [Desulfurispirillum indicum S5]|uniref:Molybdenum transport system permease n=1 Tax=Desulfurispirillum indicum (strain ATCC BAA-1389 / DSM 22839 / S5) TaxID=653733 RepID=E6W1N0_DESIS|nr:molybdate ABC transporter permease subunit [Desulfurispirillum indicum]ADU66579.1 molybdate ABC transporter, inner membrane subunit [Desulfurispirillum indicum S5]
MNPDFIQTMTLTFQVALITTIILLVLGIPLAYWLAYTRSRAKSVVETLVSMPLVLPPTVLGFYLLVFFSPVNPVGGFLDSWFNLRLVFSFEGVIVGSVLFSLPFMIHPLQSAFTAIPANLREAAATLGISRNRTLFTILLPNMKPGILAGCILSFAHTVGEFGVVLMVGGNISGETRMASIAIYDRVEALDYATAHQYAFVLFAITFAILLIVYVVNRRFARMELS